MQFRLRTLFVFSTLVVILTVGVVFMMSVYRAAFAAEDSLQAFFQAYNPTVEFIETNNGAWPKSWDDLAAIAPENDYAWVAQHIDFDFDADPEDLGKLTPDEFHAITNIRSYYNFDTEIQTLIDILNQHHSRP